MSILVDVIGNERRDARYSTALRQWAWKLTDLRDTWGSRAALLQQRIRIRTGIFFGGHCLLEIPGAMHRRPPSPQPSHDGRNALTL